MRVILSATILASLVAVTSAFAQTAYRGVDGASERAYSAEATRDWYRLNGNRHSIVRELNGTSSWEVAGPFGGNPNGNCGRWATRGQ